MKNTDKEKEVVHKKSRKRKNHKRQREMDKRKTMSREEKKRRRRRARRRIVMLERILAACLMLAFLGGGGYLIWNIPSLRLSRKLNAGMEYTQEEAYDDAIEAYESALEIDSKSVEAYRCMAGAYLDMEDESHAEQILLDGWKNTQDEGLHQYYCTVILNEAVEEINNGATNYDTVEKIAGVLEQGMLQEEALELISTAYRRLMDSMDAAGVDFSFYGQVADRLFSLYDSTGLDALKEVISDFGWLQMEELNIPLEYVDPYLSILEKADALVEIPERREIIACLQKVKQIQAEFADIFVELDAGNYEAAKEFLITDAYLAIRDAFINGTMEYWDGMTYIPVSRESVIVKQKDGKCTFAFPDYKENENTAGVITVWGNEMLDNGVQRSSITYEPAKEGEGYYPHTEYIISYMCSNVQKKNSFDYEMNYHFETRVLTEEGMITTMIGDWGGPYQWQKTY